MHTLLCVNHKSFLVPSAKSRSYENLLQVLASCRRLAALDISFNAERAHLHGLERLTALRSAQDRHGISIYRKPMANSVSGQGLNALDLQAVQMRGYLD